MDSKEDGKRMDTTDGTYDDWLNILGEINTTIIPEGYKTASQLATEFKMNRRQFNYLINKRVDEGLVEKTKVIVDGRITNAYKIKNPL